MSMRPGAVSCARWQRRIELSQARPPQRREDPPRLGVGPLYRAAALNFFARLRSTAARPFSPSAWNEIARSS